jgi:hypothetical protein
MTGSPLTADVRDVAKALDVLRERANTVASNLHQAA